jgi:hypothetical protein
MIIKIFSCSPSVIKSIHSSASMNALTVLTNHRNSVMGLWQSSLASSSILSSGQTRWKFCTIRAKRGRPYVVLGDFVGIAAIVVDFCFVTMMDVV